MKREYKLTSLFPVLTVCCGLLECSRFCFVGCCFQQLWPQNMFYILQIFVFGLNEELWFPISFFFPEEYGISEEILILFHFLSRFCVWINSNESLFSLSDTQSEEFIPRCSVLILYLLARRQMTYLESFVVIPVAIGPVQASQQGSPHATDLETCPEGSQENLTCP